MSKKINQLDSASDAECANDSYLIPLADPTNGIALKMTVSQAKEVYGTKKLKYIATGLEGSTLTLSQLLGKNILAIFRGVGTIYEADDLTPDSDEYIWDQTDIGLGADTNTNEKFLILYRNF